MRTQAGRTHITWGVNNAVRRVSNFHVPFAPSSSTSRAILDKSDSSKVPLICCVDVEREDLKLTGLLRPLLLLLLLLLVAFPAALAPAGPAAPAGCGPLLVRARLVTSLASATCASLLVKLWQGQRKWRKWNGEVRTKGVRASARTLRQQTYLAGIHHDDFALSSHRQRSENVHLLTRAKNANRNETHVTEASKRCGATNRFTNACENSNTNARENSAKQFAL